MTATASETGTGNVTRYWKTGLIITRADITGLITCDPGDTEDGQRCQVIDAGSAPSIAVDAIREQFLASMNALASAEDGPEVRDCEGNRPGLARRIRPARVLLAIALRRLDRPSRQHRTRALRIRLPRLRRPPSRQRGHSHAGPALGTPVPHAPGTRRARRRPRLAHLLPHPARTRPAPHRRGRRLHALTRLP